jgi:hypothetical protein
MKILSFIILVVIGIIIACYGHSGWAMLPWSVSIFVIFSGSNKIKTSVSKIEEKKDLPH